MKINSGLWKKILNKKFIFKFNTLISEKKNSKKKNALV